MSPTETSIRDAQAWLTQFEAALASKNVETIASLFAESATVRSLLALSWDFTNYVGRNDIAVGLATAEIPLTDIVVRAPNDVREESMGEASFVTTFFTYTSPFGTGTGFVRLIPLGDGTSQALTFVAQLDELAGHPENINGNRPQGRPHGPHGKARAEAAATDPEFREQDPAVVIIGAGHSGLVMAARLRALGVDTLVVERNQKVGDNWRNRYANLALHDRAKQTTLPYLELPSTWPRYATKDDFADYLESYATLLKLPVWTESQVDNLRFDEAAQVWRLDVTRPGAETRSLSPRHVIVATGANNKPLVPEIPGADQFTGVIKHTTDYPGGAEWAGKKAVVIGAGTTGHDIAQELAEIGSEVTLVQRTPVVVYDVETIQKLVYPAYDEVPGAMEWQDADLTMAATPFTEFAGQGPALVAGAKHFDKELLDGLERAGFRTSDGPDGEGHVGLIFRYGKAGGYYYNIGASELIIEGAIGIKQGTVQRFTENTVVFEDGSEVEADIVIFATGYDSMEESSRSLLGDEVIDELGKFSGLSEDGEYQGLWRYSGKQGLWFHLALGIFYSRFYSKLMALQIKAIEEGIIPAVPERERVLSRQ